MNAVDTVETERLLLRPWRPDDVEALVPLFAEPAMWWHPFRRGLTRDETERFVERQIRHRETHGFGMWAAQLRDGGDLIGIIGLAVPVWLPEVLPAVEVGWRLHPSAWGRGLATEGGQASLQHGFDVVGLDRIISIFDPDNVASGRVMAKLGMRDCLLTTDPGHGGPVQVTEIGREQWRSQQRPGRPSP
jgi:RimJ/RimL family protein N-acetyltransferase